MNRLFLRLTVVILLFAAAASAADTWTEVKSSNFVLVGDASEKDIRDTATRLEQFREAFRQLFPRLKLDSPVRTRVLVFKNENSFRKFKPQRADGRPDEGIAGYFLPGEDVNYITLSIGSNKEAAYSTIFHEYVHFLLDIDLGKSGIPPWFNEGLAEFYETLKIEDGQVISIGALRDSHVFLLRDNQLMPLSELFGIDNYSLHRNGNHSRSIFYAQAWALIHYLTFIDNGSKSDGVGKFLNQVLAKQDIETALKNVFGRDFVTLEKELKKYVSQSKFPILKATLPAKIVVEKDLSTRRMAAPEPDAILGDLLYRSNRLAEATELLRRSLTAAPQQVDANLSLGLVLTKERKFNDARVHFQRAIEADAKNGLAHYYSAYGLSREGIDETGYSRGYSKEESEQMRSLLRKAIELMPNHSESYELLSFVNLVNNENLAESIELIRKSLAIKPGNLRAGFLAAQIYVRQNNLDAARRLATSISKATDNDGLRAQADQLLKTVESLEGIGQQIKKEAADRGIKRPVMRTMEQYNKMTEAEKETVRQQNRLILLNTNFPPILDGEKAVVGRLAAISCDGNRVTYNVETDTGPLVVNSDGFSEIRLTSVVENAAEFAFGCSTDYSTERAVFSYVPAAKPDGKSAGTLKSLTFVPAFFRLMSKAELEVAEYVILPEQAPAPTTERPKLSREEMAKRREKMLLESIRKILKPVQPGEKRFRGVLDKIECSGGTLIFTTTNGAETLKIKSKKPGELRLTTFTPGAPQPKIACNEKPALPVVVTYRVEGQEMELVSLDFVPEYFTLED